MVCCPEVFIDINIRQLVVLSSRCSRSPAPLDEISFSRALLVTGNVVPIPFQAFVHTCSFPLTRSAILAGPSNASNSTDFFLLTHGLLWQVHEQF